MVENIKSLALFNGYELSFDEVIKVLSLLGGQESCTDDDYLLCVYHVVGADVDWAAVNAGATLSNVFTQALLREKLKSI